MNIPGFVDLQVNGYKGVDFSSENLNEQDFISACDELLAKGIAAFLPTIITSSERVYEQNLKMIAGVINSGKFGSRIPGIHLEGPFISKEDGARGAHNIAWVREPDIGFLDQLIEWSGNKIKLLTLAAETNNAAKITQYAAQKGITISMGHQLASMEDINQLTNAGASALTHLGNGIPKLLNRHNNALLAGLANDGLLAMIITDGFHLPPELIKIILRTKGFDKTIIVSDASPISGMEPGKYTTLGNQVVLDPSGKLYNPETGYLVGSSMIITECVSYLLSLNLASMEEVLEMAFYNPLKMIYMEADNELKKERLTFDPKNNTLILNNSSTDQ